MLLVNYFYVIFFISLYLIEIHTYHLSFCNRRLNQRALYLHHGHSQPPLSTHTNRPDRPIKFAHQVRSGLISFFSIVFAVIPILNHPVSATEAFDDISRLKKGLREISYLLDNWDEKTTYCNFGEVQKDILKTENKKKLLIAAAKTSFFDYDKSATMNVMCRKDPLVVRAFLGLTKENPTLSRVDVLLKRPSTVELVNESKIDEYFDAVEQYIQAVAEVDTLTYGARVDYSSTETSSKDDIASKTSDRDYLQQSKASVGKVKSALEIIVQDLQL